MRPWRRVGLAAAVVPAAVLAMALFAGGAPAPEAPAEAPEAWVERDVVLAEGQGPLRERQAWVGSVPVKSRILHEMAALLEWEDDMPASRPDTFTLELVPPPNMYAGPVGEGDGGSIEVRYRVYPYPVEPPRLGVGQWAVRVYLREAGDGTMLGLLPDADGGNDFRIKVTARVFERATES